MEGTNFVTFNVIGTNFRVQKTLFEDYPQSLFYQTLHGKRVENCVFQIAADEIFVQRSPDLFKIVLLYCINGKLHIPSSVCDDQVEEEFRFWNIKHDNICSHCAAHFHVEPNECMSKSDKEKSKIQAKPTQNGVKQKLWMFLEEHHSSVFALAFIVISLLITVISILNIILSSVPELQGCPSNFSEDDIKAALDAEDDFTYTTCVGKFVFNVIDIVCMCWFTVELLLRFAACPDIKKFITSPLTIIDILSVLPFYIELILWAANATDDDDVRKARAILMFFRLFKIFRIFRVLKLARYSLSLKVLGKTLKSAKEDLGMLSVFISIALLLFSNCLYQMEKEVKGTQFTSIPASFWWCIVTLTTVGYGDMTPQTVFGKIIAGLTCISGVLLVAFPIAVLVEKFTSNYSEEKKKVKRKSTRRR